MNSKNSYTPEKAALKDYVWSMKGIKIPFLFLLIIFAMAMMSTYAGMNISLFTGEMVDAQGNVPTDKLVNFSFMYILMGIAAAGNVIAAALATEKINLGLRTKLWRKIMYAKQSCYDNDSGESLVSRVTSDCDFASKLITTAVEILSTLVSLGLYINKMFNLNARLAVAMIWLVPVTVLFGWGYAKLQFIIAQKTQAMLSGTTTYLAEHTKSLNLIKTSNTQKEETLRGMEHFDKQYTMQLKTGFMNIAYISMQHIFNILSLLIPFIIGARLVNDKIIRVGIVIAFYSIATSVGNVATTFIDEIGTIRQANGALARVINVLKLPDERNSKGISMDIPDENIVIEKLSFSYGDKKVLQNISCVIPKNKVTALIGTNGSGKSTLFKLIDRLNDPDEGDILFGTKNVSEFDLFEWRRAFCLVAQGSQLIEGSIRENICYGCQRPISSEELEDVAKKARVYDFVSVLPEGFDTMVTQNGANFSGGQKQCIAIARAIMNNPDYLLLDEATCNLDAHSERIVMDALNELMKGRTTVIIAHSLATIRNADHVIVLHDGKVDSTGSPEDVLKATDNYLGKIARRTVKCEI
ncbi:MAG: ABC transporter ATP-binding protein [Oscillospiraceae bacterium]|nr:ABC transporter ATP-binding protein [Oscillospiraceae bacterium]